MLSNLPISIHALREEGDIFHPLLYHFLPNFYPRPPRGGRLTPLPRHPRNSSFLSTPSARRATADKARHCQAGAISIHALREEGDKQSCTNSLSMSISIHALREEGDPAFRDVALINGLFLSTPSARRATHSLRELLQIGIISIHALREEGDRPMLLIVAGLRPISIHALREEGDNILGWTERRTTVFLSTPSARRATNAAQGYVRHFTISIHALREEGDQAGGKRRHGGHISIHALREEGDFQAAHERSLA